MGTINPAVNVRVQKAVLREIDDLVKTGRFTNRQEFIRDAIREALERVRGTTA